MSEVFMISDTHFFHQKILDFEAIARPYATVEEMNETLVDRWNAVVTKRDTVWHLGDVCFGGKGNLAILDRLKGTKHLIMGNHDGYGIAEYMKYFNKIEAVRKYDGYLLSHIPIHESQFYRFAGNVHGHLHSDYVMTWEPDYCDEECEKRELYEVPHPKYVNVSCEQVGMAPQSWAVVKERFNG